MFLSLKALIPAGALLRSCFDQSKLYVLTETAALQHGFEECLNSPLAFGLAKDAFISVNTNPATFSVLTK